MDASECMMSDPVTTNLDKARSVQNTDSFKKVGSEAKATDVASSTPLPSGGDELKLSEATAAALESAEFDAEKVNKIKEMIAKGEYPLDEKRIAESFFALEQLISDPN